MVSFDDILVEVGPFGRSQKRSLLLLCLASMPMAWVYVGIVFQGYTPEHWCKQPEVQQHRERCGWTLQDSVRRTVPLVNVSGELKASSCLQYDVDWNRTALSCDLNQELELSESPRSSCKHGWEYDYEGRQSFVTEVKTPPVLSGFM